MNLVKKNGNGSTTMVPMIKNFFDNFWNADQFFGNDFMPVRNRWLPAVNIKENKSNFAIDVAAPDFDKKDFDVKVENGMLCISAVKEASTEEQEDDYTRKEFSYNSFERTFALPENVDAKNVDAKYEAGVLKLTLKKVISKAPAVKRIAVK